MKTYWLLTHKLDKSWKVLYDTRKGARIAKANLEQYQRYQRDQMNSAYQSPWKIVKLVESPQRLSGGHGRMPKGMAKDRAKAIARVTGGTGD